MLTRIRLLKYVLVPKAKIYHCAIGQVFKTHHNNAVSTNLGLGFVVVRGDDHAVGPLSDILEPGVPRTHNEGLASHQVLLNLNSGDHKAGVGDHTPPPHSKDDVPLFTKISLITLTSLSSHGAPPPHPLPRGHDLSGPGRPKMGVGTPFVFVFSPSAFTITFTLYPLHSIFQSCGFEMIFFFFQFWIRLWRQLRSRICFVSRMLSKTRLNCQLYLYLSSTISPSIPED